MGRERECTATVDGKKIAGKALLETEEIIFRSPEHKPLKIKFAGIEKLEAKGGNLRLDDVVLALGDDAPKWLEAIKNPKSRIAKLGVKAGQKVAVVGIDDASFLEELRAVVPEMATALRASGLDVIFFGADEKKSLDRLAIIKSKLAPTGAIWIVRPKGVKTVSEADVFAATKAAGLVDVKVVKLSETHTAAKVVIPVGKR